MTIEWVGSEGFLLGDPTEDARPLFAPVVRLAEVDALIAEVVWAMEYVRNVERIGVAERDYLIAPEFVRAMEFLASDTVAKWRERKKDGGDGPHPKSTPQTD